MILATFLDPDGQPVIGAVDRRNGTIVDLGRLSALLGSGPEPEMTAMLALIRGGTPALDRARALEAAAISCGVEEAVRPLADVTLLAPLPVPEQVRDFSVFELHMRQAAVGVARLRAARTGSGSARICTELK